MENSSSKAEQRKPPADLEPQRNRVDSALHKLTEEVAPMSMAKSRLVRSLHPSIAPEAPTREYLSQRRFHAALYRERSRADRLGDEFSVLVYHLDGSFDEARFCAVVDSRLRCTDEAGWFEPRQAAVLLPHTDHERAMLVASAVAEHIATQTTITHYEVFSYPGERFYQSGDGFKVDLGGDPVATEANEDRAGLDSHRAAADPSRVNTQFVHGLPYWKRACDIVGATLLLLVLSPLFAVTAALIKLTSRGPVFFSQTRAGLGARPFQMYKFRSMVADADRMKESLRDANEQSGPVFKIAGDPRITRIGRYLRKLSIDELPQLWNVLKGDMSLVGPRPPTFDEVAQYLPWQKRRLELTPGLTCIWQVSGRNQIGFENWVRLDLEYATRRSFLFDLALLARTVPAVVLMRGAN